MLIIPGIQPVPSQTINATVNNQATIFNIYQLSTGLYMDVLVDSGIGTENVLIRGGVLCENLHVIIRRQYLGYIGDYIFVDQQTLTDPYYTGLGSRYLLYYLFPNELPQNIW